MESDYLFVYGSLMSVYSNPASLNLHNNSVYVDSGIFQGKLYLVSYYPGVVKSKIKEDIVYGEIYKLNDTPKLLNQLDKYEGEGFERCIENIRLSDGLLVKAWIYLYKGTTINLKQIVSGKFEEE